MGEDRKEKNRKQFLSLLKTIFAAFSLMVTVGLFIKYAPSSSEDLMDIEEPISYKKIDHSKPSKKSSPKLTSIKKYKVSNYHSQPSKKCSITEQKFPCQNTTTKTKNKKQIIVDNFIPMKK